MNESVYTYFEQKNTLQNLPQDKKCIYLRTLYQSNDTFFFFNFIKVTFFIVNNCIFSIVIVIVFFSNIYLH